MAKLFRPWNPKQKWVLPPEISDFKPEGHASHLVRDLAVEQLDLVAILDTYEEERGFPLFHPAMMVALQRSGTAVFRWVKHRRELPSEKGDSRSWQSRSD